MQEGGCRASHQSHSDNQPRAPPAALELGFVEASARLGCFTGRGQGPILSVCQSHPTESANHPWGGRQSGVSCEICNQCRYCLAGRTVFAFVTTASCCWNIVKISSILVQRMRFNLLCLGCLGFFTFWVSFSLFPSVASPMLQPLLSFSGPLILNSSEMKSEFQKGRQRNSAQNPTSSSRWKGKQS